MTPTYQEILYEVEDPVALITLNRPEALNGWTSRMGAEVRHAVAAAEADPAVVGIVITGAGRAFCAGADLNVLDSLTEGGEWSSSTDDVAVAPDPDLPPDFDGEYTYLLATRKPVVAAINGAIAGMAVPIALCCDLRFMAEDAPLLTAFSQRGLIAEWASSFLLPRLVGPSVALDLLLSSRRVPGSECERLGIVNAAMPADEVVAHSRRYIENLAATCSPTSMAIMKRQVYEQLYPGLGPTEIEARKLMVESFERPDFREGVRSFLEKRPPTFSRLGDERQP
ncbi:MAG: enoyl-CoA hydratase-related protein [Acidimicrobiales bacterium]